MTETDFPRRFVPTQFDPANWGDARPLFRLPSSTVRVGLAYVLDEPFRHEWMYWAGLAWTL